jgi:hypothetical protein
MTFDKLKPRMTLYDVHSYTMGNTSRRSVGVWTVRVIEVNANRAILASWNGNKPRKMYEREWSKLRAKAPELETGPMGCARIKRKTPAREVER